MRPVFLAFELCVHFLFSVQVEYAIEAINNAGTCVGILAKDGIVMASERRITSGLLAPAKVSLLGLDRMDNVTILLGGGNLIMVLLSLFFMGNFDFTDIGKDLSALPAYVVQRGRLERRCQHLDRSSPPSSWEICVSISGTHSCGAIG